MNHNIDRPYLQVSPRCLDWPYKPPDDSGFCNVSPCHRDWCPCLLFDSRVTHGQSERRFQRIQFRKRLPQVPSFLTWIVHVHSALPAKQLTKLVRIVRDAITTIAVRAVVWTFVHWKVSAASKLFPHLHIGIFCHEAESHLLMLAYYFDCLAHTVKDRGSRVRKQYQRGRPPHGDVRGDDPLFTRIDTRELREGGEPDTWLGYVMRCNSIDAVRPPHGCKWIYGSGLTKAKHVIRTKAPQIAVRSLSETYSV